MPTVFVLLAYTCTWGTDIMKIHLSSTMQVLLSDLVLNIHDELKLLYYLNNHDSQSCATIKPKVCIWWGTDTLHLHSRPWHLDKSASASHLRFSFALHMPHRVKQEKLLGNCKGNHLLSDQDSLTGKCHQKIQATLKKTLLEFALTLASKVASEQKFEKPIFRISLRMSVLSSERTDIVDLVIRTTLSFCCCCFFQLEWPSDI